MATYTYRHQGYVVTARRRLTVGEVRQAVAAERGPVEKAKPAAKLAVAYDAQGQPIGLIDPAALQPIADLEPEQKAPPSVATNAVAAGKPATKPDGSGDPVVLPTDADVSKRAARRHDLRDGQEVAIAKRAVDKVRAASDGDLSEGAQAIIQMHAARAAGGAIQRHRARRR